MAVAPLLQFNVQLYAEGEREMRTHYFGVLLGASLSVAVVASSLACDPARRGQSVALPGTVAEANVPPADAASMRSEGDEPPAPGRCSSSSSSDGVADSCRAGGAQEDTDARVRWLDASLPSDASLPADASLPPGASVQPDASVPPDAAPLKLETHPLAAQAGYYATPAPGQTGALTGTDLGWTLAHRDKLWVMFGDSWWIDPVNVASVPDDAVGQISLTDFPNGPSVESFVHAHPAPLNQPAWRAAGPTMQVALRGGSGSGFAPVLAERDGKQVQAGIGCVPIAAFSNGRDDAGEGVFAIFFSYDQVRCDAGRCDDGLECDHGLGTGGGGLLSPPCVVGRDGCQAGPGFCQDRSTSIYDPNLDLGRTQAVVVRHDVGVTTPADPLHFKTQAWATQRFFNATLRTVTDFDASRAEGIGNDYTPALGNSLPRAGVFLWGRPNFGGIGASGHDARLYLAWVPMPARGADGHFDWQPRFFTGLDAHAQPTFSAREVDARALDLDASQAGDQPTEVHDYIAQMSISWVPSLKRFVMFYGGGISPMFEKGVFRGDADKVRYDPQGSMFVRFAEQPWGPWTAPRPLLSAGESRSDAQASDQYAPGGILAHNNCLGSGCARSDPAYWLDLGNNNNGVLYGPNIIDVWTTAHEDRAELYWFVSTWNPYQVVLMKTTLSR
jgi:hypothetical protein